MGMMEFDSVVVVLRCQASASAICDDVLLNVLGWCPMMRRSVLACPALLFIVQPLAQILTSILHRKNRVDITDS